MPLSGEDFDGWAGHVKMVVFGPLDVKGTAGQVCGDLPI